MQARLKDCFIPDGYLERSPYLRSTIDTDIS